jgi:hypothetical protein
VKTRAQRTQQQNPASTGSTCLIRKSSSEPILCDPPILACPDLHKTLDCMWIYCIYWNTFFAMKIWAQQAQQLFEREQAPNWWRDLIIDRVIQPTPMQSIPSRPRWGAQMGVIILIKCYPPKYIFSPPQTTPSPPNSECVPCDRCFLHCWWLFTGAPNPTNIPAPRAAQMWQGEYIPFWEQAVQ